MLRCLIYLDILQDTRVESFSKFKKIFESVDCLFTPIPDVDYTQDLGSYIKSWYEDYPSIKWKWTHAHGKT